MSPAELRASATSAPQPPAGLAPAVEALWWDAKGDWHRAHEAAQADDSRDCAWVHALLHRKEGDLGNAGYWYARAGRRTPASGVGLEEEWTQIAAALLAK